MRNLSSGEQPDRGETHKFAIMSALMEILAGMTSLSDAYACPRDYEAGTGPRDDAEGLAADYRQVGDDARSALASEDVQSPYRD